MKDIMSMTSLIKDAQGERINITNAEKGEMETHEAKDNNERLYETIFH
jgi:hypothetical protein